ncbi:hypothetical protein [Rhodanobacter hydrolyticus]|uniref:DUF2884 family protein n=1 Tax=Rhodanobacter hydrolyticus TaxID=2250595 RepID=A0ABW8J2G2_9GAMM
MKHANRTLIATVLACSLAACHVPDTTMENGAIRLYGDVVTLHVDGASEANIAADGGFTVGGNAVVVTPAERALLAQYNQSVRDVRNTGLAIGKAGVSMATKAITTAVSSSSGNADKATKAGSDRIEKLSLDICKDTAAIKDAQDQLAAQLVAFKPYAAIVSADDVASCEKDAKD